jgi:hypothetical protein
MLIAGPHPRCSGNQPKRALHQSPTRMSLFELPSLQVPQGERCRLGVCLRQDVVPHVPKGILRMRRFGIHSGGQIAGRHTD